MIPRKAWPRYAVLFPAALLLVGCDPAEARSALFIVYDGEVAPDHLVAAPDDPASIAEARKRHSEIRIVVERDMSGQELLRLYGLEEHRPARDAVARATGRGIEGRLEKGRSLRIPLNDLGSNSQ